MTKKNLGFVIWSLEFMKHFSLSQQWVLLGLALFTLSLLYFRFYYHPAPGPEAIVKEFVVEVSGEIPNPGVYLFQKPPTLGEAIERAGGLKGPASIDIRETSEILETGTLLTIDGDSEVSKSPLPSSPLPAREKDSTKEEHRGIKHNEIRIKVGRMAANKLLVFSIPLDLNRVSMEDLCLIPGIGASLAQEIISYRGKRKAFRSVDELKKVKGIGEKKWKAIRNYFTAAQPLRIDPSGIKP